MQNRAKPSFAARPMRLGGVLAVLALLATGCGFHLRGQQTLPFETLFIPSNTALGVELKRNLGAASRTRVVNDPKQAEAVLRFIDESREKIILSFDSSGRVREYQLRYRVGFRVTDARERVYIPTSQILLTRDISFNDAQILAKESEEALLYRDMQTDMVQQLLRRIAAARAARPEDE